MFTTTGAEPSDEQAELTVTVTDGKFVSSWLRCTGNEDLWNEDPKRKSVAEALKDLGFHTREHLDRQLLEYDEKRLWEVLERREVDPALTYAAKDAFVRLVRKAKGQARDGSGLLEHFINVFANNMSC